MNQKPNRNDQSNNSKPNYNNQGGRTNFYPPCQNFKLYADKTKGIVGKDLYDATAKAIADSLLGISQTRLRRFFDEVKSIARHPGFKTDFVKEEASISLLKSKISYMIGRARNDRDDKENESLNNLKKFFEIGLQQVDSADSYLVFVTLFEAVYGFFYEKRYNSQINK